MKTEVQNNEEDLVKVKEQAILELGSVLAETGQGDGRSYLYLKKNKKTNTVNSGK